jgi:PAS domain S-box-containing protein
MESIRKRKNLIGRFLLGQSLIIAIILTILFTSIQVLVNYQNALRSVNQTFIQIEQGQVNGISTALWNFSNQELIAQIQGLTHFKYINYAEVHDNNTVISSAGIKKQNNFIDHEIQLNYLENDQNNKIGTLYLQADRSAILKDIFGQTFSVLGFQALIIFLVLLAFMIMVDRRVTRPLNMAADYFRNSKESNLDKPLVLNKKPPVDEIDLLVDSFNDMRTNLINAYRLRSETERKHSTLLANLPGMAYRCNPNNNRKMELVSAGSFELTGHLPDEFINNPSDIFSDMIHPEDRQLVSESIAKQLEPGKTIEISYRIVTRSGEIKSVLERGIGLFDDQKKLLAMEGFIIDISQQMQQQREIQAIATISNALRSVTDLGSMLPNILDQTTRLMNADGGTIEIIDPITNEAVIEYANGLYVSVQGLRISPGVGLNTYIQSSGKTYLNNHVDQDPMIPSTEMVKICRAVAGVPLIAQDNLIGFLWIGRNRDISMDAVRALSSIADIAANSIHRAILFQQTEQRLRRLIALRKIDTAINGNYDIGFTLDILLDQVIHILQVDAADIWLLEPDRKLHYMLGLGFQIPTNSGTSLRIEDSFAYKPIMEQKLIVVTDLGEIKNNQSNANKMVFDDFCSLVVVPLVTKNEVMGVMQAYFHKTYKPDLDWIEFFETLAGQAAIALSDTKLLTDLTRSNLELQFAYDETIEGWSSALDLRDHETEGHSQRVTEMSLELARLLKLSEEDMKNIKRGSLLHDIGKMGVPDSILFKPGKLTDEEWEIMRKHPIYAFQLLSLIKYLAPALDIPYCHHERWDGTGYPRKLKGQNIPLAARIFAIVDVWDALTSDRPYRQALSKSEALEYIPTQSGKHFDPDIVKLFISTIVNMEDAEIKN